VRVRQDSDGRVGIAPSAVRFYERFIASYHDLLHAVTDAQLPNPEISS